MRKCGTTLVLVFAFAAYGAAWQAGAQSPVDPNQSPTAQQPADQGQQPADQGQQPGQVQPDDQAHQPSGQAQQPSDQAQQPSSAQNSAMSAEQHSISGCLQAAGDNYTLQTQQGAVQVKAESDVKQEFEKYVGQEVRVVGDWASQGQETASNRDPGAALPQADQPNAGANSQDQTFTANRVDVINQTCTTSGMQSPHGMSPGAPPESRGPEEAPQNQTTQPPAQ